VGHRGIVAGLRKVPPGLLGEHDTAVLATGAADADIIIDVRFLPNPYYEASLRVLTGLRDEVRAFVLEQDETQRFLDSWRELLDVVMPGYVKEGKQILSIGVGCTGGQHRSVVLAEETGRHLAQTGYSVTITHRDLALAEVI
jgi:UPF0042 nucleotide-binding protein